MLRAAALRGSRRTPRLRPAPRLLLARNFSDHLPNRYEPPRPNELDEHIPIQPEFRQGVEHVVNFYSRFFQISAIALVTVASTLLVGWEGAHQYIEHVALAAPPSSKDDPYQWGDELESWTGATSGGTDPSLGIRGRHAVRAAWMVLNWSGEPSLSVIESTANEQGGSGNAFDAQLHQALNYLKSAIAVARSKSTNAEGSAGEATNPTIVDLLTLSGNVLGRIGTPSALTAAKPLLQEVLAYHISEGHTSAAARLNLKLGDVHARLGEGDEAVQYWRSSLSTLGIDDSHLTVSKGRPGAGIVFPSSPAQQRVAASALLSLSAHYASVRNFAAAKDVETVGMSLIAHELMNVGNESTSPDRLLHHLFLYYRATILLMHYAEVSYAEQRFHNGLSGVVHSSTSSTSPSSSSRWAFWRSSSSSASTPSAPPPPSLSHLSNVLGALEGATLAAEEIATLLTSTPPATAQPQSFTPSPTTDGLKTISSALMRGFHTGASIPIPPFMLTSSNTTSSSGAPPPPSTPLSPAFTSPSSTARTLKIPAETLLRQSKRASATALHLRGLLYESQADIVSGLGSEDARRAADVKALECYERALGWVGGGPDGRTGESAMESEWRGVWEKYVSVRERVMKREKRGPWKLEGGKLVQVQD